MQTLFIPFINRGCALQSVSLSFAREALSLHIWQSASLSSKKHHAADIFFPSTGKVFCCTKACVSGTAPYADQCEGSDPDSTDIVAHLCLMFCADAATLVAYGHVSES